METLLRVESFSFPRTLPIPNRSLPNRIPPVSALRTTPPPVSEVAEEDVLQTFFKERQLNGDLVSKVSDVFWKREFANSIDTDDGAEFGDTPQLEEQVTENDAGGFLKLSTTNEWVLGDISAPVNRKARAKALQNDSDRRRKLNLLQYEAMCTLVPLVGTWQVGSRTQCTRLPLYAGSGRGECRLALPPFMERLLPSLEPETYRSWTKALAIAPNTKMNDDSLSLPAVTEGINAVIHWYWNCMYGVLLNSIVIPGRYQLCHGSSFQKKVEKKRGIFALLMQLLLFVIISNLTYRLYHFQCSCLYLKLLYQQADNISRDAVPQIFRQRKTKKIGIRTEDLEDFLEKMIKGCGIALSSPRLVIPAAIYGLWILSHQKFAGDLFDFQLVPAMLGLFVYKAAALYQVYRDNEDLQFIFPDNEEGSNLTMRRPFLQCFIFYVGEGLGLSALPFRCPSRALLFCVVTVKLR
ncbi:hypothetical protein DVH24_039120 [Malus domestica]|uniref:Uncharacterized protein n=1 Tax=Malus domestica TaxID=3750 RepID=A0A498KBW7_MALDO|nr:hypothetical protein DVH24_039120 [Malus domestica]